MAKTHAFESGEFRATSLRQSSGNADLKQVCKHLSVTFVVKHVSEGSRVFLVLERKTSAYIAYYLILPLRSREAPIISHMNISLARQNYSHYERESEPCFHVGQYSRLNNGHPKIPGPNPWNL